MNEQALIYYLSHRLHTVYRQFSSDGRMLFSYCAMENFNDLCFEDISFPSLFDRMRQIRIPLFFMLNHLLVYALVPHIEDTAVLIGPVRFGGNVPIAQNQDLSISPDWPENVYVCPFGEFIEEILLLHNLYASEMVSPAMLLEQNLLLEHFYEATQENYVNLVFDNLEHNIRHNPYEQEVREQQSIADGDLEQLERSLQEEYTGKIGTLAKEPLRHYKNLCIVLTTLASRTAIRAGLSPELSFSLSDCYIQQAEEINDIHALLLFAKRMECQYTSLVHEIKKQREPTEK